MESWSYGVKEDGLFYLFVIARNEAIFPAKSNAFGRLLRCARNDKLTIKYIPQIL